MSVSLRARVVYPVSRPPIENGVVTLDGERIVAVGAAADDSEFHDLGEVALLPGFVNAHTHLEFSYLKQPLGQPGMRLADWIRLVIAERGRRDIAPLLAMISGYFECLKNGACVVGDITTTDFVPEGSLELKSFAEVIGFSRARAVSALSGVIERLDQLHWSDGMLPVTFGQGRRFGISPHAPYTVSPFLLNQLVELATIRQMPVAMHLAESAEELQFLSTGTGPFRELLEERSMWDDGAVPHGSRALDYLRMLSVSPRALVIHGNYLDAEEQAFLAEHVERMSLVYCPRTHAYFAHRAYPLPELLRLGVRVALGTDSRASNPDLDLLAELRHVARAHTTIDPQEILQLGTLNGAEALGRAAETGSLTAGKLANMVAVPLPPNARGGADVLLEEILAAEDGASALWVRGQLVGH